MIDGRIGLYLLEQIDLARELMSELEFQSAICCLKKALENVNDMEGAYAEEIVRICKLLGLCYRKENLFEDAIKVLKMGAELCQKQFLKGNDKFWRRELAVCYVNSAIVYDAQTKLDMAVDLYETAIALFDELGDYESRVKVMLSLGNAYRRMSRKELANGLYEEAMDIIDSDYALERYRILFCELMDDVIGQKGDKTNVD